MSDYQDIKALVLEYYAEQDMPRQASPPPSSRAMPHRDIIGAGMHPFNEIGSAEEVGERFLDPLKRAIRPIQRRPDVFMAGSNDIQSTGGTWVCCMGHLLGLFDTNWLGIPPTRKMVFFRFVEFHQVEGGRIVQTAHFFDIPSVMRQSGYNPFPPETGQRLITPGPRTHDGLLHDAQDPASSRKTMDLINRMISELVVTDLSSPIEELARSWHEDMIWFGPAGIGATYTHERYFKQHQAPFRYGLHDIDFQGHICRFSEGRFGGFFGWPNLTMRPIGGFMGMTSSEQTSEMRVVDIYRREGDLLAENWIFIDLLHFFLKLDHDILGRMTRILNSGSPGY